jgi:hypothetical protein
MHTGKINQPEMENTASINRSQQIATGSIHQAGRSRARASKREADQIEARRTRDAREYTHTRARSSNVLMRPTKWNRTPWIDRNQLLLALERNARARRARGR